MKHLILRWLLLTASILVASYLIKGIHVTGFWSAFLTAAVLGVLNAFLRPVLLILTLPINILTLGLFTFIINALLLMMATGVISGFRIDSFWSALLGSFVISMVNWIATTLIHDRRKEELPYIDLKQKDDQRWEA